MNERFTEFSYEMLELTPTTLRVAASSRDFELRPAPVQSQVVPPRGEGKQRKGWQPTAADDIAK